MTAPYISNLKLLYYFREERDGDDLPVSVPPPEHLPGLKIPICSQYSTNPGMRAEQASALLQLAHQNSGPERVSFMKEYWYNV